MEIRPISLKDANAFVMQYHRHHNKVQGHKFSIACYDNGIIHGVAIVGRPVSRRLDDGFTVEVTRLCTDGHKNACSFLYSSCAKAAKQLGYKKIITYILDSENGTSLKASGWNLEQTACGGGSWDKPSRPRTVIQKNLFGEVEKYPTVLKKRYSKQL